MCGKVGRCQGSSLKTPRITNTGRLTLWRRVIGLCAGQCGFGRSYGHRDYFVQCGMGRHDFVQFLPRIAVFQKQLGYGHEVRDSGSHSCDTGNAALIPYHLDEAGRTAACLSYGVGGQRRKGYLHGFADFQEGFCGLPDTHDFRAAINAGRYRAGLILSRLLT